MKLILLFCFSGFFLCSFSQDKNQFYALDKNMNQTVLDSSKYILWINEKEDSNWQWDYYYTWGPLVKSNSYADHDGTILNGRSSLYNSFGNLDSTGVYDHGKKNGWFYKLRSLSADSIKKIKKYNYIQDSLVEIIDLSSDSNKKKVNDTTIITNAEYPGGVSNWYSYLQHGVKYPDRAMKKEIQGTVRIYFTVDEEGYIKDLYLKKSVEYSIDQEALRVIQNSGKWTAGTINGVKVKMYMLEPIKFGLVAK
jgi:periplasmic protein TonB